jgi:hypothetical protein
MWDRPGLILLVGDAEVSVMRGSDGPQGSDVVHDAAKPIALLFDIPFLLLRPSMQINHQCLQHLDVIGKAAQHATQVYTGCGRRRIGGMSHDLFLMVHVVASPWVDCSVTTPVIPGSTLGTLELTHHPQ